MEQYPHQSPILLINQLRTNQVPGTVHVTFRGKNLGTHEIAFVHMSTLQLSCIEPNRARSPLYIPNPLHCPATFEVSADGRTFVTIRDADIATPVFELIFHNQNPNTEEPPCPSHP